MLISEDDTVKTIKAIVMKTLSGIGMLKMKAIKILPAPCEILSLACADVKKQIWPSVPSGTLWYVRGLVMLNINCLREFPLSFQH